MTPEPGDLTVRPITGRGELELFGRLPYVLNHELADDLGHGRRRPEWMWLALRDDRLVARLAWWARQPGSAPFLLDVLDLDDAVDGPGRVATGARLLRTALASVLPAGARPADDSRFVTPGWRADPVARRGIDDRMAALELTGARVFVERLRLEWRPGTSQPAGVVADRAAARWGPRRVVIPARNSYHPIIGYIGVLPAHRGNGYIDDLLAEGTRILAAHDVPRIRAATDLATCQWRGHSSAPVTQISSGKSI